MRTWYAVPWVGQQLRFDFSFPCLFRAHASVRTTYISATTELEVAKMLVASAPNPRSAKINDCVDFVDDEGGEDTEETTLMNAIALALDEIDYNPEDMSYVELVQFWQTRLL
jgi:hypothetical protein